jgi:hypothetical protein
VQLGRYRKTKFFDIISIFQESGSAEEGVESQPPAATAAILEHGDEEAVAEILDREAEEQIDCEAQQPMEDS